jgi:hypothetical protein
MPHPTRAAAGRLKKSGPKRSAPKSSGSKNNFNPKAKLDRSQVSDQTQNFLFQQDRMLRPWSGLMLESISKITKSNGDVVHQVKPMDDPKKDEDSGLARVTGSSKLQSGQVQGAREQLRDHLEQKERDGTTYTGQSYYPHPADRVAQKRNHQSREQQVAAAEKAKAQSESSRGRALREEALGIDKDAAPPTLESLKKDFEFDELSLKEYNALTQRQRAVVDWNTMLSKAVQTDLANQDNYDGGAISSKEREKYDKAVKSMFGEGRGSDLYAPATVAILQRLNINPNAQAVGQKTRDESVADLDDYLNLELGITADELKTTLAPGTESSRGRSSILNSEQLGRTEIVGKVADRAEQMAQAMANGQRLLQDFGNTALQEVGEQVTSFGGQAPTFTTSTGFGDSDVDMQFREYFGYLANANIEDDPKEILDFVRAEHGEEGLQEFLNFADTFSRQHAEQGLDIELPTQSGEKVPFRSAREIRQRLGLDR